ncbi:hypothetical protein AAAK29_29975 [Mesorhizobium sp. CCNWLW179-1]|uniref:hypothetical protein n=1 Tax=unclassified Mesorhizobium TaxID=325217 RepID=UPI0030153B28
MEEPLTHLAVRYRVLRNESFDLYAYRSLASYCAAAGGILFFACMLFPDYLASAHPMRTAALAASVSIVAGIYLLTQSLAEKRRNREIRTIEAEFLRHNLNVDSDGNISTSTESSAAP